MHLSLIETSPDLPRLAGVGRRGQSHGTRTVTTLLNGATVTRHKASRPARDIPATQRPRAPQAAADAIVHRIATPEDDPNDDSELIRRVVATRLANVETVFDAINDGNDTITEIQRVTGLARRLSSSALRPC